MQKSFISFLFVMFILLELISCSFIVPYYSNSSENYLLLRKLAKSNKKISVGNFTEDQETIMCRLAGAITPANKTFAQYIQNAFKKEFILAGIYNKNAPIKLTGHIIHIDLYSMIGQWILKVKIKITKHSPFVVTVYYPFHSALDAYEACQDAEIAFPMAVQKLIFKTITNSQFQAIFNKDNITN